LEGDPAFSPDGGNLAYTVGPEGGQRKIFVRNLVGGDGIRVTNDDFDERRPAGRPMAPISLMSALVPANPVI